MIIQDLDQQKKEKDLKRKKQTKFLKLYILPIFTIIVFVTIIGVFVIPKINQLFAVLDEISTNNDNVTQLSQKLSEVKALDSDSNTILSNLDTVNNIATSQNTQVVSFRDKISNLISQNGLNIISQRLSESTIDPDSSTQNLTGNVNLVELPFIFEIVGPFENIKSFIASLNTIDDFVIVKEMEITVRDSDTLTQDPSAQTNGDWSLKIDLVKYQFLEAKDLKDLYLNAPATAKISDDMKAYIELRQQKAQTTNQTQQ
ncbi:MAG: hypothetical protein ABI721_02030 [Candidatus Dojkabacteria bacterium]